jgi:hypothetical protein
MSGSRGGSSNFGVRLALEGAEAVESGLRRVQASAAQTGQAVAEAGDATGRALTVIERGTQAASTGLTKLGGDFAALAPVVDTAGGAIGRVVTALGSGAGLLGVVGAAAAAITGAVALYQNWDTAARAVAGAVDTLTGRLTLSTTAITSANDALRAYIALNETAAARAVRGQVETRQGVLDSTGASITLNQGEIGQAERRIAELNRPDPTGAGNRFLSSSERAEQARLEADIRERRGTIESLERQRTQLRGEIAALNESTGSVLTPPTVAPRTSGGGGARQRAADALPLPPDFVDPSEAGKTAVDTTRELASEMRDLQQIGSSAAKTLAGGFEDVVFNGKRVTDVLKNMERELLSLGTRALVLKPLEDALQRVAGAAVSSGGAAFDKGGIGGLFGSLFGGGGAAGSVAEVAGEGILKSLTAVAIAHTGGMVGDPSLPTRFVPPDVFAGAPRFHGGGMIGPDERPVIAQTGERILNRQETAAYNRGGGGSGSGVTININGVKDPNAFRSTESQLSAFAARTLGRSNRNR